jgi:hypothetical protein
MYKNKSNKIHGYNKNVKFNKNVGFNRFRYGKGVQQVTKTIATYYFRINEDVTGCAPVQNFENMGVFGPCAVEYTNDSKYWVAIANAGEYCNRRIIANYNKRSIVLIVKDSCPACEVDNHLDMGLEALIELTGSKENACAIGQLLPEITWSFI